MDLLLGPDNDLVFINGECPVTKSDFDVVAQRLKIRLQTFQEEYQFNVTYGVPYFQRIFGKRIRKQEIDNIFEQQILQEEGIVEVIDFESTFVSNIYTASFKAKNDKRLISPTIEVSINI
jgi:hypothetical protein